MDTQSPASRYWQAPSMKRRVFATWEDFFAYLDEYQSATSQVFTKRSATSVKIRNQTLSAAGKGEAALIPEEYEQYSRTMHCTGYKVSAEGKRRRKEEMFAECKAQINATLKQESNGTYRIHVTKAFLVHNHPLAIHREHPPWIPPEPRVSSNAAEPITSRLSSVPLDSVTVAESPSKRQRVVPQEEGPTMSLRDFLARMKSHQSDDSTVETRLARYVKEFDDVEGSVAKIFVDGQKVLSCITMQTKNMRRVFDSFPEVLRVECSSSDTRSTNGATNASTYRLFSLLAHDTFGMWQFVQHAIVENGRHDSWSASLAQFRSFNPKWANVRAIIVDRRDAPEISLMRSYFPKARILLSQFRVVKELQDAIMDRGADLSAWHKDRLCTLAQLLVYAPTELVYVTNVRGIVEILGSEAHPFVAYFRKTWDACHDMWSTYKRENVTTFGANESRRLETTWREIQSSVGNSEQENGMTLDETVASIQFFQAMVERSYMTKLRRSRTNIVVQSSGPTSLDDQQYDDEMKLLASMISPHACQLVQPQYTHAIGRAQYRFCEPSRGTFFVSAVALNDAFCDEPGKEFCVEEKLGWQCSCAFMVNHHLPCRHVFYIRRIIRCKTIIPIETLERRWVLREVCAFFDSGSLTSDSLRVHVRGSKTSEEDSDASMDDENRNTVVVSPGSWEKFVSAMDIGKRIGLHIMQLSGTDFDGAIRYYQQVEKNIEDRDIPQAARMPSPGSTESPGQPSPSPPSNRVGRPPIYRPASASRASGAVATSSRIVPSSSAATNSSAPSVNASETLTVSKSSGSMIRPRDSELPSLDSLSPPVIDLQGESEVEDKEEGANGSGQDRSDEDTSLGRDSWRGD